MKTATLRLPAAAALCVLALASCNLFMPVAQSPLPRQPDGMVLLSHSSISVDDDLENVRIRAATLDGASPPDAYVFIDADDRYFDGFLHYLEGMGSVAWVQRNGVSFEDDTVFYAGGEIGFYARDGSAIKNIQVSSGSAIETTSTQISDITVDGNLTYTVSWNDTLPTSSGAPWGFVAFAPLDALVATNAVLPSSTTNLSVSGSPVTNAVDTLNNSFEILNNNNFWNGTRLDIRRGGHSASGSFFWGIAERHDDIRQIHEQRLFSLYDVSASPRISTSDHTPQGTAGPWIVAGVDDSDRASHEFVLLDAALTERHAFKLYGTDVRYLGETVNTPFGPTVPASVFVVLSALRRPGSGDPVLHLSLWACPTAELDQL